MAIDTPSRQYADNFRKLRRYLQGRGVNLRETVVDGSVYAGDRIEVPGMHADDAIVSVIDLDVPDDVTGYLDAEAAKATLDVFSSNKGVTFTARRGGSAGNDVTVQAAADPDESAPLSVDVDGSAILVNLATDGAGAALTTSANSAANVRAAVLQHPVAGKVVDAALDGTGATAWTSTGPTPLAGGDDFSKGPSTASLVTALGAPYDVLESDLRYVAREPGADGNGITVEYDAGVAIAVEVTSLAIKVTYVAGTTTAKDVMDAVNANADASALVVALPAPGDPLGSGAVADMNATNLTGGLDPGIRLTVGSGGDKLKVLWLTKDERDENGT